MVTIENFECSRLNKASKSPGDKSRGFKAGVVLDKEGNVENVFCEYYYGIKLRSARGFNYSIKNCCDFTSTGSDTKKEQKCLCYRQQEE